jgi:hypothetical protein
MDWVLFAKIHFVTPGSWDVKWRDDSVRFSAVVGIFFFVVKSAAPKPSMHRVSGFYPRVQKDRGMKMVTLLHLVSNITFAYLRPIPLCDCFTFCINIHFIQGR